MPTPALFCFPELSARTKRMLVWMLLLSVAVVALTASTGAMAQSSLDTSRVDGVICSILKIFKKFAFYALVFTLVLLGIAVKLNESKGMFMKVIQIVVGVWVILNSITLATLMMPSVAASFCSDY